MSPDSRRWVLTPQDPELAESLASALGSTPLVGQVLINRGLRDTADAERFLTSRLGDMHDPYLIGDMGAAIERIVAALLSRQRILVHGDYDVDGVTATALLVLFLRDLGFDAAYHIPNRLSEGYGLSAESVRRFHRDGVGLLLTVDCGISAVEAVSLARSLGMGVVVTDHHEPPAELPPADALINPLLPACTFPFKDLSGVGLAFYLAAGLRKGLRERGFFDGRPEPSLVEYLDLVAVGTIADIAPLTGLNRILVRAGLEQVNLSPRLGLRALLEVCGVARGQVDATAVAFRIAPKINAAGRLSDGAAGVRLLTTQDPAEAEKVANFLDIENAQRQRLEDRIFTDAVRRIEAGGLAERRRSLVLDSAQWHPGVVGIVASRLMERYHRPTVLLCLENGVLKGSARGIPQFHLYQGLSRCQDLLLEFGGHKYAAGIKMQPENLDAFVERFEQVVAEAEPSGGFVPLLTLDAETQLEALTMENVQKLGALAPFGAGNPEPVVLVRGVEVARPREVGKDHLSFTARRGDRAVPAIAFRQSHWLESLDGPMDLAAVPEIQTWRGVSAVKLRVRAMRPADVSPSRS